MSDDAVRGVLSGTPILLLGFDGPICSVFSGYPARTVADEVRRFVVGQGAPLPAAAMATDDPLEVLVATEQTGDSSSPARRQHSSANGKPSRQAPLNSRRASPRSWPQR